MSPLLLVILLLSSVLAFAGEKAALTPEQLAVLAGKNATLRGANGSTLYTSSTTGGTTTIRASNGSTVATASTLSGQVTFRGSNGGTSWA